MIPGSSFKAVSYTHLLLPGCGSSAVLPLFYCTFPVRCCHFQAPLLIMLLFFVTVFAHALALFIIKHGTHQIRSKGIITQQNDHTNGKRINCKIPKLCFLHKLNHKDVYKRQVSPPSRSGASSSAVTTCFFHSLFFSIKKSLRLLLSRCV